MPRVHVHAAAAIALIAGFVPPALAAREKPASETGKPTPAARGSLFAAVLGPGAKWKKGQPFKGPGLEQHRAYWKKLHAEGRVASAGPLGEDTGLILLRARSQAEATALVAADPAVKAQILRGIARPYRSTLTSEAVLAGT